MSKRVKGATSVRKLLRRLPDSMRQEMADAMEVAGRDIAAAQRRDAPVRTGRLRAGISYRMSKQTLKLRAGFIGKPINRRLFYGRIVEFGRKAKTVTVRRKNVSAPYALRVAPMRGRRFVYKRRPELMAIINRRLKDLWGKILSDASRGVGLE